MKKNRLKMRLSFLLLFLAIPLGIQFCGYEVKDSHPKEAWDGPNAPEVFGAAAFNFEVLSSPEFLSGELASRPWSDTYWPLKKIGSAHRYGDPEVAPPFSFSSDPTEPSDQVYFESVSQDIVDVVEDIESFANAGLGYQHTLYLSPAEKYDLAMADIGEYPLTMQELRDFAKNRRMYTQAQIDWDWMGLCHGWAPASYLYAAPKNAVLVKNDITDREVLFTPGDVRGLLTKAAADNGFNQEPKFLGTRCSNDEMDIVRDSQGRIIDGTLGLFKIFDDQSIVTPKPGTGEFVADRPVRILENNWFKHKNLESDYAEMVVDIGPDFNRPIKLWITAQRWHAEAKSQQIMKVKTFTTRRLENGQVVKDLLLTSEEPELIGCPVDALGRCTAEPDQEQIHYAQGLWQRLWQELEPENMPKQNEPLDFRYYKSCRDLNPGSFHNILAYYLSPGFERERGGPAKSFVMDMTQSSEVWNQAVYSFRSKMGRPTPIELNSAEGEKLEDPFKPFRARGTTHIVDVYTRILYGVENGPFVQYEPDDEALYGMILHYTLELDEAGNVLGGEWHKRPQLGEEVAELKEFAYQPKSGAELLRELKLFARQRDYHIDPVTDDFVMHRPHEAPDFIWHYESNVKLGNGDFLRGELVEKMHSCSVSGPVSDRTVIRGQRCEHEEGGKESCEYREYPLNIVRCDLRSALF